MRVAMGTGDGLRKERGFSFVELMVSISVLAILAGVLITNINNAGDEGRDAKRQGDLRNLQNAIELYKNKYGRYPEGCRGPDVWSGQKDTSYACVGSSQYIVGLAPEFITALPVDPRLAETSPETSGYVYTVNSDGTVYKLMARRTVESEVVTINHEFKACNVVGTSGGLATSFLCGDPCRTNTIFSTTYAVWGGFESDDDDTRDIICKMN